MSAFIITTISLLSLRLIFSVVFVDQPVKTPTRRAVAVGNALRLAWIVWGLWLLWRHA